MAAHPPFIPDCGLRAGVANEPSHCAARMIAIRASDRIVVTLSSTRSFKPGPGTCSVVVVKSYQTSRLVLCGLEGFRTAPLVAALISPKLVVKQGLQLGYQATACFPPHLVAAVGLFWILISDPGQLPFDLLQRRLQTFCCICVKLNCVCNCFIILYLLLCAGLQFFRSLLCRTGRA